MQKKILIVEDQFVEAHDLRLIMERKGHLVTGIARSVAQARELVKNDVPDLVLLDIFLQGKETGLDLAKDLHRDHIGFIFISANSNQNILDIAKQTQPYGFIVKPFREQDIVTTLEIAFYRQDFSTEAKRFQRNYITTKTLEIIQSGISKVDALISFGAMIQPYLPFCYLELHSRPTKKAYGIVRKKMDEYEFIDASAVAYYAKISLDQVISWRDEHSTIVSGYVYSEDSFWSLCNTSNYKRALASAFGARSLVVTQINTGENTTSCWNFYSKENDVYTSNHLTIFTELQDILTQFGNFLLEDSKVAELRNTSTISNASNGFDFQGLIGVSSEMFGVYDYVRKVAKTDTSVLILGESGTGKEKIAQCIHSLSMRNKHPLIVINCGAIPDHLAESILFGHEKGAFTGAISKRIGKFEQAEGGTIFLDEIGEMPIDLQVKLLRVLQEREIEPLGSKAPVSINVRVIAATNKQLEDEIANGKFRLDLYYRLHVFPIHIPALRDRKEDIRPLADHFNKIYAEKLGIKKPTISKVAYDTLLSYSWPGNIRELEHVIQRNLLLMDGDSITTISLGSIPKDKATNSDFDYPVKSFNENERDYILSMLKKCNGKVSGSGGAADLLGIPASTLTSKMKKLGIK